jgi:hypothetical protein
MQANYGEPELALKSVDKAKDFGAHAEADELAAWQRLADARASGKQGRVQVVQAGDTPAPPAAE